MKSGKSSANSAGQKKQPKKAPKAIVPPTGTVPKKTIKGEVSKLESAQPLEKTAPAKSPVAPAKSSRKVAPKKAVVIPPMLLEGDQAPLPPFAGTGERFNLGTTTRADLGDSGELPEAYGTKRLLLAARDPHWLYARWDLTREQQRAYNALARDRHLVIRIFVNQIKGTPFTQVHVHPESTHWFIHVGGAGTKYLAELGYYSGGGDWNLISTSGTTLTPPDTMSDDLSAEFATIPVDVPFTRLMELAQTAVRQNVPTAEVLQQLRAGGYEIPRAQTGSQWTPERERALAAIITMDQVRRVWMGSLEITELIRRQLQHDISSVNAAQFSAPSSHLAGGSSLSSAFGGGSAGHDKSFWFNVNAELIIYGATEPDAEVTIGGRPIKLRRDGTFSYRFALPDGQYELPAIATSADKSDRRAAELKFSRGTEYRGEVGLHPQDSALKTPRAENVS